MGMGIAAWFVLPDRWGWAGWIMVCAMVAALGLLLPQGGRLRHICVRAGLLAGLGCLLVWGKAIWVGEPPLARAMFTEVRGEVIGVAPVPAQGMARLILAPRDRPDLPRRIRLNLMDNDAPADIGAGAVIRVRARLMPPAPPAVPGAYDFAARAYFMGIGATGRAVPPVLVERPAASTVAPVRQRLSEHIRTRLSGGEGGIATALATGDQGAISEADADAMRRSGLAHLLSISGLHVTALVGAAIFIVFRLLALPPRLALHAPLMLISAGAGALAGIGYTLLTGAEVPTVRSCVAALLVLGALALGREAITLRLVAAGAIFVLIFWPDALVGPSFQMSFAAVTAIIALSEMRWFRALTMARDEGWIRKFGRNILGLLLTGAAVELVLAPIALFHFHRAGMLGSLANLVAIPLTTFVVMPFEAIALLLDVAGLGAPAWWIVGKALSLLLAIAHMVAALPGAVALAAPFPGWVFAVTMAGLLWCLLWRGRLRWLGLAPALMGALLMAFAPAPDILVTGDGRHLAIRTPGGMATLRDRAGDYVRDTLSEAAGEEGEMQALATLDRARCNPDLCAVTVKDGAGRGWRLLATRSATHVDAGALIRACAMADIVVSDRGLPRACRPGWLKLDRWALSRSGGVALFLRQGRVSTVRQQGDAHPWIARPFYRKRARSPGNIPSSGPVSTTVAPGH
ncbi:ComEC/Rec2 family competence protein [Sphingobium aquiterrae]|uniref:ComEC/Rec2 family competence protein n=1 Tax=Sphingobium aquiterrae TaxID=2038656 RepID=UPI00301A9994